MLHSVEEYLIQLREELAGSDPATLQDALADAEEYLRAALELVLGSEEGGSEAEALQPIIEKYGSPGEIAAAYREIETLVKPAIYKRDRTTEKPFLLRFLSVLVDARAWAALLYLLLSIVTGIVYFTWAITGLSLSLGLFVLIIGLPFTVLFFLSVRSIALVEGRIVEALLGVRMPRRPLFTDREAGLWEQVKGLFLEGRTWTTVAYLILQLPLGVLYFSILVTLLSTSVALMAVPVLRAISDRPLIYIGESAYTLSLWMTPLAFLAGFLLLLTTMHLAQLIGGAHGAFAKILLVGGPVRLEDQFKTEWLEESMDGNQDSKQKQDRWTILTAVGVTVVVIVVLLIFFLMNNPT
jgi:uncharacterized membrane protein